MNTQRIIVLSGLALVAAIAAAFMVRGLIGGGAFPKARPDPLRRPSP